MTKLLKEAYSKVETLSDGEQDVIASIILDEIQDEAQWEEQFTRSQAALQKLALEALQEHKTGKTAPLTPDSE